MFTGGLISDAQCESTSVGRVGENRVRKFENKCRAAHQGDVRCRSVVDATEHVPVEVPECRCADPRRTGAPTVHAGTGIRKPAMLHSLSHTVSLSII